MELFLFYLFHRVTKRASNQRFNLEMLKLDTISSRNYDKNGILFRKKVGLVPLQDALEMKKVFQPRGGTDA